MNTSTRMAMDVMDCNEPCSILSVYSVASKKGQPRVHLSTGNGARLLLGLSVVSGSKGECMRLGERLEIRPIHHHPSIT